LRAPISAPFRISRHHSRHHFAEHLWDEEAEQEPPAATALRVFVSRDGNIGLTGLKLRLETAGEYSAPAIERILTRAQIEELQHLVLNFHTIIAPDSLSGICHLPSPVDDRQST